MRNLRDQHGFTLIEMVVALAVIASISGVALLSFPPMIESYRLRQASSALTGTIREAQVLALREGRPWRVRFDDDGLGFKLEQAPSLTADTWNCDEPWLAIKQERFEAPLRIDTNSLTRKCVAFGASGRAEWPTTQLIGVRNGTLLSGHVPERLFDGEAVRPDEVASMPTRDWVLSDPRTVAFSAVNDSDGNPKTWIDFDLQEQRRLGNLCIGMINYPTQIRYPSRIQLRDMGSSPPPGAPAQWPMIFDTQWSGFQPPEASSLRDRICFPATVGGTYHQLRLILWRNASYFIVLDEIDVGDMSVTLRSSKKAYRLTVTRVTGIVEVQTVNP